MADALSREERPLETEDAARRTDVMEQPGISLALGSVEGTPPHQEEQP